jgi:hypothetical protein
MLSPLISWSVFFAELDRQQAHASEHWLLRWAFGDDGAILMDEGEDDPVIVAVQQLGTALYEVKRHWPEMFS